MIASDVINRAIDILNDGGVRHLPAERLRWLSDAQQMVVMLKPEANAVVGNIQLASGTTKQALPAYVVQLFEVFKNMGTDGSTPGRAIRVIDRDEMDTNVPTWHSDAAATSIEHYCYDSRYPKHCFVYPRPSAAIYVEAAYSKLPAEVTADTDTLELSDIYRGALLDGLLYRAFSKDASQPSYAQRALAHYQAMQLALGIKTKTDRSASPVTNSPLVPQTPPA